jgi:glutathione S-transferase
MHWIAAVMLLALLEFLVFGAMVGSARTRYNVPAPAVVGHPMFERAFRVHYNTMEALVVFIPSLWLFGLYLNPRVGALIGVVFVIGRAVYAAGYMRAPEKRHVGAGLSFLCIVVLVLGAIFGVARLLWAA